MPQILGFRLFTFSRHPLTFSHFSSTSSHCSHSSLRSGGACLTVVSLRSWALVSSFSFSLVRRVNNNRGASCFIGVSSHSGGGFLTPLCHPICNLKPYLQEKTTAIQRFGVGGSSPRVYSFDPHFYGVGPGFWQLGLLGTILLPIFMGLAGYFAMKIANRGDISVLLDKPMETDPVESPGHLP
ncbi:hypothetical protein L3X38_031524 [Prunus dulcis]|uniref:Transmembrane protein n=1 Tax=Prunus dulcis TaxID=3755 RepID=A0AAD4VDT2_PRUDU|nr:hypothetical protein L3X38_031524 [Prunus dulcis]